MYLLVGGTPFNMPIGIVGWDGAFVWERPSEPRGAVTTPTIPVVVRAVLASTSGYTTPLIGLGPLPSAMYSYSVVKVHTEPVVNR